MPLHPATVADIKAQDVMPHAVLDSAVDEFMHDMSVLVLQNEKVAHDDCITIDGVLEFPCDIFNRFRPGQWFDAWTLDALMMICDKPTNVHYGHSVPLDQSVKNKKRKMTKVLRPLAPWRRQIESHRREAQAQGRVHDSTYLCPLNHGNTHFSALEINEREMKIFHYDSLASPDVITGTSNTTRAGSIIQVSLPLHLNVKHHDPDNEIRESSPHWASSSSTQ